MLRSKLEPRLRGLIVFAVVSVVGAMLTGHPAQSASRTPAATAVATVTVHAVRCIPPDSKVLPD